jgi:hypothetical protein
MAQLQGAVLGDMPLAEMEALAEQLRLIVNPLPSNCHADTTAQTASTCNVALTCDAAPTTFQVQQPSGAWSDIPNTYLEATGTATFRACNRSPGLTDSCTAVFQVTNDTFRLCGSACVDTSNDVNNCGACNHVCAIGQLCVSGECACPASAPTLCGGACTNLATDNNNCSQCGHICQGALGYQCTSQGCVQHLPGGPCGGVTCRRGQMCCGDYCANICE